MAANIAGDAADTIDARGKLVVPGLIDIHTHTARTSEGPGLVLADGVTGWIDAGSQGADRIGDTAAVARMSPQQGRVLINIGRAGILPDGDTMDIALADTGALRDAIAEHRDVVVGVKARLTGAVTGENDDEVLRRAQEVATSFDMPLMIHMGQSYSPLPQLVDRLKTGDIVTHMFAPPPNSIIIDDSGRILPEVLAARRAASGSTSATGETVTCGGTSSSRSCRPASGPTPFPPTGTSIAPRRGSLTSPTACRIIGLRHVGAAGGGARDHQCLAHLRGVPRPRAR